MIIKDIATKYGFNCDDFEKWLVEHAGVQAVPELRKYDLQDDRVGEIVQRYTAYIYSRQSANNGVAPQVVFVNSAKQNTEPIKASGMGIARIVVGILTIILSVIILIVGLIRGPMEYSLGLDSGANAGVMIIGFVFLLAGGIVMVSCHKKGILGGCIACTVLFLVGTIISIAPDVSVGAQPVFFIILLIFSIVGIILNAIKKL